MSLPAEALQSPFNLEMVTNTVSCALSDCYYTICQVHGAGLTQCFQCKGAPFKTVVEFSS